MTYTLPRAEYKVLLKRGEFVDPDRNNRVIPYKIYYPSEHTLTAPMPVIFWSHGFGGNRDGAGFIARHMAGKGYTVVHVTHQGSDSSLWEGRKGHPWDVLRKTPINREMALNRFRDIPFAVDQVKIWAQENPEIGQFMDFERMGMSGHSFGAMTSQSMAGELFQNEQGDLQSFADKRFKAFIFYSPAPIRKLTHENPEPHLYGPIMAPAFHMTGTDDASPLEGFGYERRLAVYENSGSPEKYLLIFKDGDHMVYNGTRGQLGANPNREAHEEIINTASLAFWEAYLRGDDKAKKWLISADFTAYVGSRAEFRYAGQ